MRIKCNFDKPARWNCLSGDVFQKLCYLLDALAEEIPPIIQDLATGDTSSPCDSVYLEAIVETRRDVWTCF